MKLPFSKYEILGRIVETVTHMPADANQLALCNAIACSVWDYFQDPALKEYLQPTNAVVKPAHDIFDTEHVDDIPAEIKPKRMSNPVPVKQTTSELPPIDPLYAEKTIDLVNNYIGQYTNPCSTSCGKCRQSCWQTELWLFDKKTDTLTTVDVEFATLDELRASLDPYVEYAKKHRVPPKWQDKEINDAMDDLARAAKESKKIKKETRMDRFVELYNLGYKTSQIAHEMDITEQGVYSYKSLAKARGLIK